MTSCELRARTCILRNQVEQLRSIVQRHPELVAHPMGAARCLIREVARGARKVEAWGTELVDPCALAAAAEAHHVIALTQQAATGVPTATEVGAVVILQLRHAMEVDVAGLPHAIKIRALDAIVADAPCPLEARVGLLEIEDENVLDWAAAARRQPAGGVVTTIVPLLVALCCCAPEAPNRLMRSMHAALLGRRLARDVPWSAETSIATLPLPASSLELLSHRCQGDLLVGRTDSGTCA